MLRTLHRLLRAGFITVMFLAAASAQHHYLVQAPAANIKDICSRFNLQYVTALSGSAKGMYVVNSPLGLNPIQALLQHVAGVLRVEEDVPLALPETLKASVFQQGLKPDTTAASQAITQAGNSTGNDGTGNQVWSAYVNQPAAITIKTKQAHNLSNGAGTVAILDTGVDFTNPVLKNSMIWGYDFVNNIPGGQTLPVDLSQSTTSILDQSTTSILDQSTTSILDSDYTVILDQSTTSILDQSTTSILDAKGQKPINDWGHGTMVAGLVHLVAPNAKLMPVKVFDANGGSSLSLIVQGIHYAVDNGAHVINMSFSMTGFSQALSDAIAYANGRGVVLVAAAGNEGKLMSVYPASYSGVMGIGATDASNNRASFSNYGPVVALAAPGVWVITTYPGNKWAAGSGTSFSAPLVAGLAALAVKLDHTITPPETLRMADHAHPLPGQQLGAGLLDLLLACNSLSR